MAPACLVLWPKAHRTFRTQRFGNTGCTKQYNYNGLNAHCSPHSTYAMVWEDMAHRTIEIQLFECPRLTKRYVYISVGTHGWPNFTNNMVSWPMAYQTLHIQLFWRIAHQTFQIHYFENLWLTKRYVYKDLRTHGWPNLTNTCFNVSHVFNVIYALQASPVLPVI